MPQLIGNFQFDWPIYLGFALAYLIGAIPFGLLLTRALGLGDIRKIGSGNIGATNVLRTGNKLAALATLLLDAAKGAVPILFAWHYGQDMAIAVAFGAVLGHILPVWLLFRGGKGVATTLGVLLAIAWPVGLIACATWLVVALSARISSLSSLSSLVAAALAAHFLTDPQITVMTIAIGLFVATRHAPNIGRLLRGKEPRIGRS
jgi:acyl phosphate:glycerol-3-phosphate acyltransferase